MTTSACSPSPTSRRKTPARPFQRTGSPPRQVGLILPDGDPARSLLRWLAFRGSPPGNRCLPDKVVSLVQAVVVFHNDRPPNGRAYWRRRFRNCAAGGRDGSPVRK